MDKRKFASVGAFGQSEQLGDFIPNLTSNLLGSIAGYGGANILNTPQNIWVEQSIAKGADMGYQSVKDYYNSRKSK